MPDPVVRFQRTNFLVADIDRSLTFYRDVLGFEAVFIKDSDPDSYSYDVFEIDQSERLRFAVLKTKTQANVMALTEVSGLSPDKSFPRRAAIVLEVMSPDDVVKRSRELGLTVYREDHLITKDGREGREFGIVDFDGNLVVIYKITKAAS